jgi:Na+(H+)/acetate symporter ActP
MRMLGGTSASSWKTTAITLAVLLVAALVVIAMIATELTDFSFSLF